MIILTILMAVAVAVAVIFLFHARQHIDELNADLEEAKAGNRNIDRFLNGMFEEMRSEGGISGTMHVAARYLKEQCDAEAAVIYEFAESHLVAVGLCGAFPLVHSSNRIIFSRPTHLFELLRREHIRLGQGFLGSVVNAGQPELVANAALDPRFDEYPDGNVCGSVMAMPLAQAGKPVGVACVFGNHKQLGESFRDDQFELFSNLAPQLTMALDLVHAYGEVSRRERIDQELDFARQIQFSLLPDSFPEWDQFAVTAFTRSAKEVNGDFYDFVEIDENRLLVVIGDACGKGVPACMLTAMTRSVIRAMSENFVTLGDFLRDLNRKLYRGTDADRFITLGCCLLDRKNSLLEFGRAGHTELLAYVRNHIRAIQPDGAALGIIPDDMAEFDTFCTAFEPGMSLLLYSDGLSEAINVNGVEFGVPRLKELFRIGCNNGESARGIINLILEEVGSYEAEQGDDQTLVIIQHT